MIDDIVQALLSALLRFALGAGLISAVADRLGLWGAPGSSSVTWGNMANFETYTKKLAPWCPGVILPTLAWGVTIAELVLGLLLIVGLWRKPTAVLAALVSGAIKGSQFRRNSGAPRGSGAAMRDTTAAAAES